MRRVYLETIELSEFRTFSETRVDLTGGPGVLIVAGPNGLGKSTLFDAIEWGLAGAIERFRDAGKGENPRNYLRRWHADPARPTTVALTFSGQAKLWRDLDGGESLPHGARSIAEFLRDQAWLGAVRDVHRYLQLTHFLGQSSIARLTHREPRERWELLKGPAQSDVALRAAQALHGHGNSAVAAAYKTRADEFDHQARSIESLLIAEALQFEGARAEGAYDETHIARASKTMAVELERIQRSLGYEPPSAPSSDSAGKLEALQGSLDSVRQRLRERQAAVSAGSRALEMLQSAQREIAGIDAELQAARRREVELQAAAVGEAEAYAEAHVRETATRADREAAEGRLGRLESLRSNVVRAEALQSQIERIQEQIVDADAQLQHAEGQLGEAERLRVWSERISARAVSLAQATEMEIVAQQDLLRYAALIEQADQADAAAAQLRAQIPAIAERISAAREELTRRLAEEASLSETAERVREAVDEVSRAVAVIAGRTGDADRECPVCASVFAQGELPQRASAAAGRLAPRLAPIEAALTAAHEARASAEAEVARLSASHNEVVGYEQRAAAARSQAQSLQARLFGGAPKSDVRSMIEANRARLTRLERRRGRLENLRARWSLGSDGEVRQQWAMRLQARNDLRELAAGLPADLHSLGNQARALRGEIMTVSVTLGLEPPQRETDLQPVLTTARAEAEQAQLRADEAVRAFGASAANHAATRQSLVDVGAQVAALAAGRQQRQETVTAARATWSANMSDWPFTAEGLREAQRLIEAADLQLAIWADELASLQRGAGLWKKQQAHRQAFEQLCAALSAPASLDRAALRDMATARQAGLLQKAQTYRTAKTIAHRATEQIDKRVEDFNSQYLRPLNRLMGAFNRAILTEPEIGVNLQWGRQKVQQKARKSAKAPAHVADLDPLLVHSEGQMAALAVSMLCAASLTFPWSRWPALILDDPLQHNDVVHASAFADMLRNLVADQGYQVFLSTHDVAQADFLRRKFLAGSIDCTVVRLLGQGDKLGTEAHVDSGGFETLGVIRA